MKPENNLERFLTAQKKDYPIALSEIKNGKKQSHWMWYIFPQIEGLGTSEMSRLYAIKNIHEAVEFLNHPVLGTRFVHICSELLNLEISDAHKIFGSPDDLKLHSSITLFSSVSNADPVFQKVLVKFFEDEKDELTMEILKRHNVM